MYSKRIHSVQRSFVPQRIDALLVSNSSNIRYLTGFSGSNALLFITKRQAHFFTDVRYREEAEKQISGAVIHVAKNATLLAGVSLIALKKKLNVVGFEAYDLRYASFNTLQKSIRPIRCAPVAGIVESQREKKDDEELASIRKAVSISDVVFSELLHLIRPGVRELDLAAEISFRHRRHGATGDSFEPIVLSGPRSSLVHGAPSSKKIKSGELVLLDFGCRVDGYCSDMTRTVAVGRIPASMKKMYAGVLNAQRAALERVSGNIAAAELDESARSSLDRDGCRSRYFEHGLGHGVGLDIHEKPVISGRSSDRISERSVITIEPGVYIPSSGGIRIEDVVLVHADHGEPLTSSPKELLTL